MKKNIALEPVLPFMAVAAFGNHTITIWVLCNWQERSRVNRECGGELSGCYVMSRLMTEKEVMP